jgi:ribosomal protein L4
VDAASFDEPSTQRAAGALDKWGAQRPTLVVLETEEVSAAKSFRNLPGVTVVQATAAGVADLIASRSLVLSQTALEVLAARAADVKRAGGEPDHHAGPGSSDQSERSGDSEE